MHMFEIWNQGIFYQPTNECQNVAESNIFIQRCIFLIQNIYLKGNALKIIVSLVKPLDFKVIFLKFERISSKN